MKRSTKHAVMDAGEVELDAPSISVVIPTLNREEPLCNTLRYFLEVESYPAFEVIVIDQSEDHQRATLDFLASHSAKIRYVRAEYKGLPKARNHGVRIANGEIIVFVDDDVKPFPDFLFAHARPYANKDVIGVTGPILVPGQSLLSREAVGDNCYRTLSLQQGMRFDVDFTFSAEWAAGCNMSFRRSLINDVGGFDEVFQRAPLGDDAEFCHRARKKGSISYEPHARLVHLHEASGGCRDDYARSQRDYAYQVGFCANYYWFRVEAPFWRRWLMLWRSFREYLLYDPFSVRNMIQSSIGFCEGVLRSSAHIRRSGARSAFLPKNDVGSVDN